MTSFPVTKGFIGLPVKTMRCLAASAGKTFHTVCAELCMCSVECVCVCVFRAVMLVGLRVISNVE